MAISNDDLKVRFSSREVDVAQQYNMARVRDEFAELAQNLNRVLPEGRAKSMALTELETAAMWAQKSIAEAPRVAQSDE